MTKAPLHKMQQMQLFEDLQDYTHGYIKTAGGKHIKYATQYMCDRHNYKAKVNKWADQVPPKKKFVTKKPTPNLTGPDHFHVDSIGKNATKVKFVNKIEELIEGVTINDLKGAKNTRDISKVKVDNTIRQISNYGHEMTPSIKHIYTFYTFENYWYWLNNEKRLHKEGVFIRPEDVAKFEIELERYVEFLRQHLLTVIEFSCLAEIRHFKSYAKLDFGNVDLKRPKLIEKLHEGDISRSESNRIIKNSIRDRVERMQWAAYHFNEDNFPWEESYGGNAWYHGCQVWLDLYNAKTLNDKMLQIDRAYDLQHNSGCLFDKHSDYEGIGCFVQDALTEKFHANDVNDLLFRMDSDFPKEKEYRCHLKYMKLFRKYYRYCYKKENITKFNHYIYE